MFKYDPLYRLLEATGREANNTPAASGYDDPGKYINPPTPGGTLNAYQTRAYKQRYEYDKMGRMVKTVQTGVNGWTRNYAYESGKNRLDEVRDGSNTLLSGFTWDTNGNMQGNNSERHYRYDHADRMTAYYNKPSGGNATKYAAYFYDGSGARTTKFIWTPGTGWECVTYIDGMFEHHHNHTVSTDEYKNYIQLDGGIEVRVGSYSDDTEPAVIYNFSDHLNSVSFRLGEDGDIIDREEYYPYGETSLRTFERKRYRYTGKEKDGESGLYYYGARYYVPWLAYFTSTDPAAGSTFYQSSYNYADCNPIVMNDPTGMQSEGQSAGGGGSGVPRAQAENAGPQNAAPNANSGSKNNISLGDNTVLFESPKSKASFRQTNQPSDRRSLPGPITLSPVTLPQITGGSPTTVPQPVPSPGGVKETVEEVQEDTKSFWESVKTVAHYGKIAAIGALNAAASDAIGFGLGRLDARDWQLGGDEALAYNVGQLVGDIIGIVVGVAEMAAGTAGTIGGALTAPTGVGALVMVASPELVAVGATTFVVSGRNALRSIAGIYQLLTASSNQSDGGSGTSGGNDSSNTSSKPYNHPYKYDKRVRDRALEDPSSHNFPYTYDDAILATTPTIKPDGYKIFQLEGTMNDKLGVFEIGLRTDGVIDHRFFRPYKK